MEQFINKIKLCGINTICFDFERTLTTKNILHSDNMDDYMDKDIKQLLCDLLDNDIKVYITELGRDNIINISEKIIHYMKKEINGITIDEISFTDIKMIHVITPHNIIDHSTNKPYTMIPKNRKKEMYELVRFHSKSKEHEILIYEDNILDIPLNTNYNIHFVANFAIIGLNNMKIIDELYKLDHIYFNIMAYKKFIYYYSYSVYKLENEIKLLPNNMIKFVNYNGKIMILYDMNIIPIEFNGTYCVLKYPDNIIILKSYMEFYNRFNCMNYILYNEKSDNKTFPSLLGSFFDKEYFTIFLNKYMTNMTSDEAMSEILKGIVFANRIIFRKSSIDGYNAITILNNNKLEKYIIRIQDNIEYIEPINMTVSISLNYNEFIMKYKNYMIYNNYNKQFNLL
jgi:hypothetical protein